MKSKGNKNFLGRSIAIGKVLFWKNRITAGLIYTSFLLNILVWVALTILIRNGSEVIIGHYNIFFGIDVLISSTKENLWELFVAPMGGLIFLGLSILMSLFLILQLDKITEKEKRLEGTLVSNRALSFMGSRLLLIGAWLVQLIIVIYAIAIWRIN